MFSALALHCRRPSEFIPWPVLHQGPQLQEALALRQSPACPTSTLPPHKSGGLLAKAFMALQQPLMPTLLADID